MKKTLVALAALSAISAFAQSSVQITGYFDRGFVDTKSSKSADSTKTIAGAAGTTRIEFRGTQDLGGGNAAGFFVETDWADFGGASQSNALKATSQSAGFANSENFISLTAGGVGTFKLGAPNTLTFANASGVASPAFSTGVGSAYSSKFSTSNGITTGADGYGGTAQLATTSATAANVGSRSIRINNTVQYVSPAINGVTVGAAITPQNNQASADSGYGNTVGVTEYGIRYTAGQIDTAVTTIKYEVGSAGTKQYNLGNATVNTADSKTLAGGLTNTVTTAGLTYAVLPQLKLHTGYTLSSSSDDLSKSKASQFGATYTIGAFDVLGQTIKVADNSTTGADRQNVGLGVNYNLSKTTRLYFRNEHIQYSSNKAKYDGNDLKRTAIGISTAF